MSQAAQPANAPPRPPRHIPDEIIDSIIEQVDLSLRKDPNPLSPLWHFPKAPEHEAALKALSRTSKACYRAAMPRLVRCLDPLGRSNGFIDIMRRGTSFAHLCLPKWRPKIEGVTIEGGIFSDAAMVAPVLDDMLSSLLRGLSAHSLRLIAADYLVEHCHKFCATVVGELRTFRNLSLESCSSAAVAAAFITNQLCLTSLSLLDCATNLFMLRRVLSLRSLTALDIDFSRLTIPDSTPNVAALCRLRYLKVRGLRNNLATRRLNFFFGEAYSSVECLSVVSCLLPAQNTAGQVLLLPQLLRLEIRHAETRGALKIDDMNNVRYWLQAVGAGIASSLTHFTLPEDPWAYAEVMEAVDCGNVPALKQICLESPLRALHGTSRSTEEVPVNRDLLRRFLDRRGITPSFGDSEAR